MMNYSNSSSAQRTRKVKQVLWLVLALNLVVALAKIIYGLYTRSAAMQADGIHAIFDSAGNVVSMLGLSFAARPADSDHPYGHKKFETYASVGIAIMLIVSGLNLARGAFRSLNELHGHVQVTTASFVLMLASLGISLMISLYERRQARALRSEILNADAMHTLSDVLVSVGVIASLILIKLGYQQADACMTLLVALAIVLTARELLKQAHETLSDKARIDPQELIAALSTITEISNIHEVRSRGSESEVYVDLHMVVCGDMSVRDAHELADRAELLIHETFPQVVDSTIHIEPDEASV